MIHFSQLILQWNVDIPIDLKKKKKVFLSIALTHSLGSLDPSLFQFSFLYGASALPRYIFIFTF